MAAEDEQVTKRFEQIKSSLDHAGWVLTGRSLGAGGGGATRLVYRKAVVAEAYEIFRRFATQAIAVGKPPIDYGAELQQTTRLIEMFTGVGLPADSVGVVKTAHAPGERFWREVQAMRKVKHKNLAQLLDAEPGDRPGWFVLPFYPGGDLRSNKARFYADPVSVLTKGRGIAEALTALHATNTIHRDIKPGNIFVDNEGNWILGDLGIAFVEDEPRVTTIADSLQSHNWRPDWAESGPGAKFDARDDIFMLAKTLYYLILNKNPRQTQYRRPENDIVFRFPMVPGIQLVKDLLMSHITEDRDTCASKTTGEFLGKLDQTLAQLKSHPKLLFSHVATNSTTQTQAGVSFEVPILIPEPTSSFSARVRTVNHGENSAQKIFIDLLPMLGTSGTSIETLQGFEIARTAVNVDGEWSEVFKLGGSASIFGWYKLRVRLQNAESQRLGRSSADLFAGIVLYSS